MVPLTFDVSTTIHLNCHKIKTDYVSLLSASTNLEELELDRYHDPQANFFRMRQAVSPAGVD